MAELIITPKTKVAELLAAYPQLAQVLIDTVPAFEKLKNPVLYRTVARITSLQQAATIGGVRVEDLINRLRKDVGQDQLAAGESAAYTTAQPAWFAAAIIWSASAAESAIGFRTEMCLPASAAWTVIEQCR